MMDTLSFVKAALAEDVGRGDLFARVGQSTQADAYITAKSSGVLAGRKYADTLLRLYAIDHIWHAGDGDAFDKGDTLLEMRSDSHTLMQLERTLLNILLHASSIATKTARFVQLLKPYDCKLLDTRKTRPGLRSFEKYAARCGGGVNHRMGLDDSLMLKDTHLKTINDLAGFIRQARKSIPFTSKIEVECESFAAARQAFEAGCDIVMCDNMDNETIAQVVKYRNTHFPHILLEASGNVTEESIEAIAQTGIEAISTGASIHQANWIDLSMKVR